MGWGPCCHLSPSDPGTKAWAPGLQVGVGVGGGVADWPQCDLQRPPEKGTWPLPAQTHTSLCPLALEGL